MKKIKTLTILNALFFLVAFLASNLSQLKLFADKNIGEVSSKYDTVFAPAGITFSVWGLIYLALFGFCIYHLKQAFTGKAESEANWEIQQIDILFIINNIAATAWVFAWLYESLGLSVALMVIQLLTLTSINIQLDIFDPHKSRPSKIFTQFPLSIYFAWICIATIANISAALVEHGWNGWGISAIYWTIILIGASALISAFIILVRRNIFFGLIVIWALYGIILKRNAVNAMLYKDVILAAWAAIAGIGITIVLQLFRSIRPDKLQI